ncbi:hypothetical protein HT105_22845, partial [Bacteroides fragilis]|nr:hypothetical protein [Bacteroides fragilis]
YGPGILAMLALVLEKVQTLPWWLWPFSALGKRSDVASHRTELRIWAGITAVIILGVGLPWGLATIGVLPAEVEGAFFQLNTFVGVITARASWRCSRWC